MANLRFDGYAIDYVEYPAGMEWFLKRDINLHRTVNQICHFETDTRPLTDVNFFFGRLSLLTEAL
jgi:hypothetical protein